MLDFNHTLSAWAKTMAAPFAELHSINSHIGEQLSKDYADMASTSMANAIRHLQTSLKTRDVEEMAKLQVEYITDLSSKCIGFSKDLGKTFEGVAKEYKKWFEDAAANVLSHDCCRKTTKTQ